MINTFMETLWWGVAALVSAVIASVIFDFDKNTLINVVVVSFILGCIRGYTGKHLVTLLLGI